MNSFAMEKLAKRWSGSRPKTSQPKNLQPYQPGTTGIFLPSQKGGLPHERDLMRSYFEAARKARPDWQAAVTAAFVALKELSET
jgi:hypothetical protein